MTTTEQLAAIRAKCVELLAIAEKRTPGKWERAGELATHIIGECSRNNGAMICDLPDSSPAGDQYAPNAAFIASCAGPAESGWKATIATIDELTKDAQWFFGQPQNSSAAALSTIIKIWEETLVLSKNML